MPKRLKKTNESKPKEQSDEVDSELTIKMFFESSIMHEFINKNIHPFFLAKPIEFYQVSMMYS